MGQVEDLEDIIAKLEDEASGLKVQKDDEITSLTDKLNEIEGNRDNLEGQVSHLEDEVDRIRDQRDEANRRIEKLWKKKDEEIAELKRQQAEVQGRLDRAMELIEDRRERKLMEDLEGGR